MAETTSNEATLRDATVAGGGTETTSTSTTTATPGDKTATATTSATSSTSTTTAPDAADQEALKLGRLLVASGVNEQNVNDILTSPKALQSILYAIKNDPAEFVRMLERQDPAVAAKFLDGATNLYIERYKPAADGTTTGNPTGKDGTSPDLMAEISRLRETVSGLQTREQERQNAATVAQVNSRYIARVDDMLGQQGVKDLKLTKAETKALRAQLGSTLAADPAAVQRINNGNFADVATTFKGIVEDWANDRKAAADAEKESRERTKKGAFPEFSLGPGNVPTLPPNFADSWEATEDALAKALQQFGG